MDRQKLINEIRGLQKTKAKFSLEDVETEIRKRKGSPYNKIADYDELPDDNDNAISEYLASPKFRRLFLEVAGGVAGAYTGGAFFAAQAALRPALALLYRSLGAGIGEGAAAGAAQIFDPRDDLSKEVIRGFLTGASAESIGAAIPKLIGKIGFKGVKYEPEAEKAERILKDIKIKNKENRGTTTRDIDDDNIEGLITPGIGSENRLVDILENITEKSFVAGGRIIATRKKAERLITAELDDFITEFSGQATRTNAGDLALSAVQNSLDYFRATAKSKYAKVDQLARVPVLDDLGRTVVVKKGEVLTRPITVSLRSTIDEAKKLIEDTKAFRELEPDAQKILRTVARLDNDPNVTFDVANGLRSRFLAIGRSNKDLVGGQAERYAAKLVKDISKNLDETVDAIDATASPGLRAAYDSAQRFYRLGVTKYNNKILRNLAEKAPEEVYTTLIKPRRPATVNALMNAIKNTKDLKKRDELLNTMKGTLIGDIVGNSVRLRKKVDANYILKEFQKYGDEVLIDSGLFSAREVRQLENLLDALSIAQKKAVGEGIPGAIFIQLGQAGALMGLLSGIFTVPSAAIVFGPSVIGRLFTNPKTVEFIKKGFNLKPGSEAAYRNASQLIGAMISNEMIDRDEGEDYLEELRESIQEDLQGKKPVQQFPTMDDIGVTEEPQQLATQPTLPTPSLTTPSVNPTLVSQAPTGIATLNQGLTPTEQALLGPEEQAIRLRQRGMA
mgnify:CR=1 FL=1|jgi:hypothetical protein